MKRPLENPRLPVPLLVGEAAELAAVQARAGEARDQQAPGVHARTGGDFRRKIRAGCECRMPRVSLRFKRIRCPHRLHVAQGDTVIPENKLYERQEWQRQLLVCGLTGRLWAVDRTVSVLNY
jgi:hypothetical protein